jgi:putative transcriptional regulator
MDRHRYNIQDLHDEKGFARKTVSALYYDKVSCVDYSTIEKICRLFNCGIEQLFTFKYEPYESPLGAKEET